MKEDLQRSNRCVELAAGLGEKTSVIVVRADLATHLADEVGNELWWFGGSPPEGIPTPTRFIAIVHDRKIRQLAPPWAAIAYERASSTVYAATDPIGLQHLFLRKSANQFHIGVDCLEVARAGPAALDPIAVYELLARGNPQGGRTLFKEVSCVEPARILRIENNFHEEQYWHPPPPSPVASEEAVSRFAEAVRKSVLRHYEPSDGQELTAGRDSLMILSVFVHEKVPIQTWTHGQRSDPDLLGAVRRAKEFGVSHTPIYLEPILNSDGASLFEAVKEYVRASGGLADSLRYGHLPLVLTKLQVTGSITGVGGEVFRGFYHQWAGKGTMPRSLSKFFLLHGKIKAEMPFSHPIIRKPIAAAGNRVIKEDIEQNWKAGPNFWHGLDLYYLMHRMHYFAATTFSAVGRWKKVKMPLFDPAVLDCLPIIPEQLRDWSGGLVKAVTERMLPKGSLADEKTFSYETSGNRITRLIQRARRLRGMPYRGIPSEFAKRVLASKDALSCLDARNMLTADLYDQRNLRKALDDFGHSGDVLSLIGGVLTVELAARAVKEKFQGVAPL